MRIIQITKGQEVKVSKADYDMLSKYNWSYTTPRGYAVRKGRRNTNEPRTVSMHRVIMNAKAGEQIDHINGDKLDNRRSNLRFVNTQKNAFNRKKPDVNSTSQYKGVLKRKGSKSWEARIKLNYKAIHLGSYKHEIDGAKAYNEAAKLLFKEFAKFNDVPEATLDIKKHVYEKCRKYITDEEEIVN